MTIRILPQEEWSRLEVTGMPPFVPYVKAEDVDVVVAEDAGQIVASVGVVKLTHLEGLWLNPDYRKSGVGAAALRGVVRRAADVAKLDGSKFVLAGSADDKMAGLVASFGGKKVPMSLHVLTV
jgi:GNAT superfamily N-acetyltransferase